jgi:NAD(P)H-dependent FMN reductase
MDSIATLALKDLTFTLCDLRMEQLPFLDDPTPPIMGQYSQGKVQDWADKISRYDGFLIVTPEYNHGYPAVLKNALDLIYKEWNGKPVAFVSYGAVSGGIRAVEQLRQVVIELRMIPLKDELSIPFIWAAFDEKDNLIERGRYDKALALVVEALRKALS